MGNDSSAAGIRDLLNEQYPNSKQVNRLEKVLANPAGENLKNQHLSGHIACQAAWLEWRVRKLFEGFADSGPVCALTVRVQVG